MLETKSGGISGPAYQLVGLPSRPLILLIPLLFVSSFWGCLLLFTISRPAHIDAADHDLIAVRREWLFCNLH